MATHWTKTRAGRKKMAALAKTRNKRVKEKAQAAADPNIAYALGKIEAWLEGFAASSGIPEPTFTLRVAELLRRKASRKVLGA